MEEMCDDSTIHPEHLESHKNSKNIHNNIIKSNLKIWFNKRIKCFINNAIYSTYCITLVTMKLVNIKSIFII